MSAVSPTLDLLLEVEVDVTVELGRRTLSIREIVALGAGAIVDLDHAVEHPVDLLINGRVIARGEIVAVDQRFGVHLTEIVEQPGGTT